MTESVTDVWRVETINDPTQLQKYQSILSAEEHSRSKHIVHPGARATYITVHAALRYLLGQKLKLAPQDIQINTADNKKPHLSAPDNLFFNLSHSQSISLIAISSQHEVGVDIESIQMQRDITAIAHRFFSKKEFNWLQDMPDDMRIKIFHQLWCHKEALLKGQGTGIQGGLDKVCLAGHDFNKPFHINDWTIQSLTTHNVESAAIAVNSKQIKIIENKWDKATILD